MSWDGLGLNLLSEAIGIAFTLFGVDKLIQYRHKRRWQDVHGFFWKVVNEECMRLNAAFADWLASVNDLAPSVRANRRSVQPIPDPEPLDRDSLSGSAYSGLQPFGYDFARFAALADRQQAHRFLNEFMEVLGPIVSDGIVRTDDGLWQRLTKNLDSPLSRLEQVVDTHGALIEPQLACAVLSLTRDLDHLRRGADPYKHISANVSLAEWSDHFDASMQSALASVLMLNLAARNQGRSARRRWWDIAERVRQLIANRSQRRHLFQQKQRNG